MRGAAGDDSAMVTIIRYTAAVVVADTVAGADARAQQPAVAWLLER